MGKLLPQPFYHCHWTGSRICHAHRSPIARERRSQWTDFGLGKRGCCWWTGPSTKCSWCALHVLRRLDFIARVARDRCVPFGDKQVVFAGDFFFLISSCPQRRRWLMVLLSFSFVACHNPRFAHAWYCPRSIARNTLHSRPSFVDCEWVCWRGVHAWVFEAGCDSHQRASSGNLHGKDRMFICLHCDHTCLQKSLSFAPGAVVLHRLPLMPTWSTSHRSLDFVRIVKLTTPPAVSSSLRQQNRCQCVYGLVARSSCQTGKDCFLTWPCMGRRCESGWASATFRSVYLYHLERGARVHCRSSTRVAKRKPDKNSNAFHQARFPGMAFFFQIQIWTSRQDCVQKKHKWENPCV